METDLKIKALRIDRGGKFTSNEFSEFCENLEVTRFLTALYSPQSNGVVSRRNQTGVVMARSLLNNSQVPSMYLGEAITIVVYILNRAPARSVSGMTPYEAWYQRKPSVRHLRTFRCVGHVKLTTAHFQNW